MFKPTEKTLEWGGATLKLQTGIIARQADAAILASYGDTSVLCTCVSAKKARSDINFLPLRVDYEEKAYAAGKIPGGFFKREGKPSEAEILNARLIDRPVRPLFPKGFYHETHVVASVMTHDLEQDSAIPAIIGCSAALALAGIPFLGPIGAAKIGRIDDQFILNPTYAQIQNEKNMLDLMVAGTKEGVLMVESEAHELSEDIMLDAVNFGHDAFQPVIDLILALQEEAGNENWVELYAHPSGSDIEESVAQNGRESITKAYGIMDKRKRVQKLDTIRDTLMETAETDEDKVFTGSAIKKLEQDIVRRAILDTGKRIDGRSTTDIRQLDCRTGVLPRVHGSSLFTRGETQALVVATLGTKKDEQIIDSIHGEYRQNFLLHYNFPPYSVGEAGMMRSPGRREIGHGKLAWRAIHPLLPSKEDFPYTIRVVSEITESNGSSSMASVCGASMALMDAGVPLAKPCAGVAMGLIKEGDDIAVLSDILGDEDHLGDMDFKVAGTDQGITSLQMDIKITSITPAIMEQALSQAKDARIHILNHMNDAINTSKTSVSDFAPQIISMVVPTDKIRDIIGPGGRVIRDITEKTGATIDIDDEGNVNISSSDRDALDSAHKMVQNIVAEVEVNTIYHGTVVRIEKFGAFINLIGKTDGLLHISEITKERCNDVSDHLSLEDKVYVKCIAIDERKRVRLSMKNIDQDSGKEITE